MQVQEALLLEEALHIDLIILLLYEAMLRDDALYQRCWSHIKSRIPHLRVQRGPSLKPKLALQTFPNVVSPTADSA